MIGAFLVGFGVIAAAYCERAGEEDSRSGNAHSNVSCIKSGIPEDSWINMRWQEEEQRTRNRARGTKTEIAEIKKIKVNYVEPEVLQRVKISYGGTPYNNSTFSNYYPNVTNGDVIKNHKEGRIFDENLEPGSPGEDMIYTNYPKLRIPQWIDDAVKIPLAKTLKSPNANLLPERSAEHWLSQY